MDTQSPKEINGRRIVHDILDFAGPVAFQQVRNRRFEYQCICPFCAQDIGRPVRAENYGELYEVLYDLTTDHVQSTPCGKATLQDVKVCLSDGSFGNLKGLIG